MHSLPIERQSGADDYIVKPFDPDELLARIDAVARRSAAAVPRNMGVITIDAAARRLRRAGAAIDLAAMQWAVQACPAPARALLVARRDRAGGNGSRDHAPTGRGANVRCRLILRKRVGGAAGHSE